MSNLQSFVLLSGTMLTTLIAGYFWFTSEKTGKFSKSQIQLWSRTACRPKLQEQAPVLQNRDLQKFGFQYEVGGVCQKLVVR